MPNRFTPFWTLLLIAGLTITGCGVEGLNSPKLVNDGERESPLESLATSTDLAWWRGLSQSSRNLAIATRARTYTGRTGFPNCKEWVRQVVLEASRSIVTIPQTLPTSSGWYWGASPYVASMSAGIASVQPGWVLQMNVKLSNGSWTPHTAIVLSRTSTSIRVIEANWSAGKVTERDVPMADFGNPNKIYLYSCHYILGG